MLSDREQKALREVQRRLEAEDPGFARAFGDVGKGLSTYSFDWVFAVPRRVYGTAVAVVVGFTVLMSPALDLGTALLLSVPALFVWLGRRRPDGSGRREP